MTDFKSTNSFCRCRAPNRRTSGPPESDRGQQQTLEVTPMNISNGQVGSDYSAQFRTTNGKSAAALAN